jgi:hypothetical protein
MIFPCTILRSNGLQLCSKNLEADTHTHPPTQRERKRARERERERERERGGGGGNGKPTAHRMALGLWLCHVFNRLRLADRRGGGQ